MKYFLIIISFIFFSCESEPDYNYFLKKMDIKLIDNFKVLKYQSDSAIGDYSVNFDLEISQKDFQVIVSKIKQSENYIECKNGEYPNKSNKAINGYRISGFKISDKYFLKKESKTKPIYYEVVLDNNKNLSFTYAED